MGFTRARGRTWEKRKEGQPRFQRNGVGVTIHQRDLSGLNLVGGKEQRGVMKQEELRPTIFKKNFP